MPVLPETQRQPPRSIDADPLRYLRGVVAALLGLGTVVALGLGLTGIAPKALLLAVLLWALFGVLTGMIDYVMGPVAELLGRLFADAGSSAPAGEDRLSLLLSEAARPADSPRPPDAIARDLKTLQRGAARLAPTDDIRVGLALAELYEQELHDPGRALGELRRLLDRHPQLRESVQLRDLLGVIRAQHFAGSAP